MKNYKVTIKLEDVVFDIKARSKALAKSKVERMVKLNLFRKDVKFEVKETHAK